MMQLWSDDKGHKRETLCQKEEKRQKANSANISQVKKWDTITKKRK